MNKESLIGTREVETDTVEIPGVGTATVRKLSRAEYLRAGKSGDPIAFERVALSSAMLDPSLDEHEVAAWQGQPGSSEEIAPVLDKIMKWSGFRQDAAKSGV